MLLFGHITVITPEQLAARNPDAGSAL